MISSNTKSVYFNNSATSSFNTNQLVSRVVFIHLFCNSLNNVISHLACSVGSQPEAVTQPFFPKYILLFSTIFSSCSSDISVHHFIEIVSGL
ncbi:MAG: hypothetical protein Q8M44_06370 [bacterium]|nr:hypothetical protein [bacterium]